MEFVNMIFLDDVAMADIFMIFWKENDSIKKSIYPVKYSGKTLEFDIETSTFGYYDYKFGLDDFYELIPVDFFDRSFLIFKNGFCIAWDEKQKKFTYEDCNSQKLNQLFEFIAIDYDYSKLMNIDKDLIINNYISTDAKSAINFSTAETSIVVKENRNLLNEIYRNIYDLSLCFGNTGICNAKIDTSSFKFSKSSKKNIQSSKSSISSSTSFTKNS